MSIQPCLPIGSGRDCTQRKTPPIYGEEYARVCRLADEGVIQIRVIARAPHSNSDWIVTYYGPEISFQTQTPQPEIKPEI